MNFRSLKEKKERVLKFSKGVDKILIMNTNAMDPNFLYITGFTSGLFEFSYLLIDKKGVTLLTYPLEYETAREQAGGAIRVVCIKNFKELKKYLTKELKNKTVGVNDAFLPYKYYRSLQKEYMPKRLTDISSAFSNARLVKSKEEMENIRKAAKITKAAMKQIQSRFRAGITEKDLANQFDSISSGLGSDGSSFNTIVCFGRNAALPHHAPDNTRLKYGDFILIDAGSKINNYCSDITRTFIFGGDKNKVRDYAKKIEIYNIVKNAQSKAISAIKTGMKGSEIHKVAQEYIDTSYRGRYKGTFIHSLGHSLGIEVHDGAGFSPSAEQKLEPGMIITAEPGIYIPGFGGVRIEDDVLITEKGAIIL